MAADQEGRRLPKSVRQAIQDHAPWKPTPYTDRQASALQQLSRGEAGPNEQILALKFIVEELCGLYQPPYRPGPEGQRDTDYALGRAHPGREIVKLVKLNLPNLRKETTHG